MKNSLGNIEHSTLNIERPMKKTSRFSVRCWMFNVRLWTFLFLSFALQTFAANKPNVLLILTDDQGYGDFSINGNPVVETPVLDKFAREGIRFEHFFVSPVCAPTRMGRNRQGHRHTCPTSFTQRVHRAT